LQGKNGNLPLGLTHKQVQQIGGGLLALIILFAGECVNVQGGVWSRVLGCCQLA
jgi:hypothetical protein